MPKVSKDTATHHDYGAVEDWSQDVDGYTINFGAYHVDFDTTPMLKGLPGDRCTCPHWSYVLKGKVIYTFDVREETHETGGAFYVRAGHLQRVEAGTEYLLFSPAEELQKVSENILRNMREMQGA
jgi:hypothetical protein